MDGMSKVAETLETKRHEKAELEHLRVFFLRWCEMPRLIADQSVDDLDRKLAAMDLTNQAHKLKEFYG